jgi:probable O-glycosylation ligase (exosortase A-associated)
VGLRDIAIAIVFFGSLPLIPFRPFLGLVVFSWLAYLRPQDLSWVLGSVPFSQYVALATLLGLGLSVVIPGLVPRERWVTLKLPTVWMIAMWVWLLICCQTAIQARATTRLFDTFTNLILIAILTTGLVRTRRRLGQMFLLIGFCLGALGLKYALYGALRGGSVFTTGPGGFMVDNNCFALCLNMALPLLAGVAFLDKRKAVRVLALVLALGSMLTIIFTFSRGGLLTLAAVAGLLVWSSGRRLLSASILVVALSGFFLFAGDSFQEEYLDRAGSIKDYEQDESARGRIEEWGTAIRIGKDYPIFGVGPNNLAVVYSEYSDREYLKVTHNSFLQFMVDTGYPGMALLAGLLLISLFRLQVLVSRHRDDEWVRIYAKMLQISLIAYIIGGSFLNMAYLDLLYHLVALGVCLELVAQESPVTAPKAVASEEAKPWYLLEPSPTRCFLDHPHAE